MSRLVYRRNVIVKGKLIGITGILGAGKTTLGKLLAEYLGHTFIEEEFEENPHFAAFHTGQSDFFACQRWFFERDLARYQQSLASLKSAAGVVLDKPFFENRAYNEVAPLTEKQKQFFNTEIDQVVANYTMPDVLVDLEISTELAMHRIQARRRSVEQSISIEYVVNLQKAREHYKKERTSIPVVQVQADEHDFMNDPAEVRQLASMIFNATK
jgi:deoxyadenosine/deoxycytidine kinase